MASYQVINPDGIQGSIEGPAGLSPMQLQAWLQAEVGAGWFAARPAPAAPPAPKAPGFVDTAITGGKHWLSDTGGGMSTMFDKSGAVNSAAKKSVQDEAAESAKTPQPRAVSKALDEEGLWGATKQAFSNAPHTIAENLGPMGIPLAVGVAASPFITPVGGAALTAALSAPSMMYGNVKRQAQVQMEANPDAPVDINRGNAVMMGLVQGAAVPLLLAKIPGLSESPIVQRAMQALESEVAPAATKAFAEAAIRKAAAAQVASMPAQVATGIAKTLAVDPAIGVGMEAGTRLQAGQSLTDKSARDAYIDAGTAMATLAPLTGVHRGVSDFGRATADQSTARKYVQGQDAAAAKAAAPQPAPDTGAAKNSPEYLDTLAQRYAAFQQAEAQKLAAHQQAVDAFGPAKPDPATDPSGALAYERAVKALQDFKETSRNSPEAKALIEEHADNYGAINALAKQRTVDAAAREQEALSNPDTLDALQNHMQELQSAHTDAINKMTEAGLAGNADEVQRNLTLRDRIAEELAHNTEMLQRVRAVQEANGTTPISGKNPAKYQQQTYTPEAPPSDKQLTSLTTWVQRMEGAYRDATTALHTNGDPEMVVLSLRNLQTARAKLREAQAAADAAAARRSSPIGSPELAAMGPQVPEGAHSPIGSPELAAMGPQVPEGTHSPLTSPTDTHPRAPNMQQRQLAPSRIVSGMGGAPTSAELWHNFATARAAGDLAAQHHILAQLHELRQTQAAATRNVVQGGAADMGTPGGKALQDTTGARAEVAQPHYEKTMRTFDALAQHLAHEPMTATGPMDARTQELRNALVQHTINDIEHNLGQGIDDFGTAAYGLREALDTRVGSLVGDLRKTFDTNQHDGERKFDLNIATARSESLREGLTDLRNRAIKELHDVLNPPRKAEVPAKPDPLMDFAPEIDGIHQFESPEAFQKYLGSKEHAERMKAFGVTLANTHVAAGMLDRAQQVLGSITKRLGNLLQIRNNATARIAAARQAQPLYREMEAARAQLIKHETRVAERQQETSALLRERDSITAAIAKIDPQAQRDAKLAKLDADIVRVKHEFQNTWAKYLGEANRPDAGDAAQKAYETAMVKHHAVMELLQARARAEAAQPTEAAIKRWFAQDAALQARVQAIDARIETSRVYIRRNNREITKIQELMTQMAHHLDATTEALPEVKQARAELDATQEPVNKLSALKTAAEGKAKLAQHLMSPEGQAERRAQFARGEAERMAQESQARNRAEAIAKAGEEAPASAESQLPAYSASRKVDMSNLRAMRAEAEQNVAGLQHKLDLARQTGDASAIKTATQHLSSARAAQAKLEKLESGGEQHLKAIGKLNKRIAVIQGDESQKGSIKYRQARADEPGITAEQRTSRLGDVGKLKRELEKLQRNAETYGGELAKITEIDHGHEEFQRALRDVQMREQNPDVLGEAEERATEAKNWLVYLKETEADTGEIKQAEREATLRARELMALKGVHQRKGAVHRSASAAPGLLRTGVLSTTGKRSTGVRKPLTEPRIEPKMRTAGENSGATLSEATVGHLRVGRLNSALRTVSMESADPVVRRIASKLADVVGRDVPAELVSETTPELPHAPGSYTPGDKVRLNTRTGLDENTLLHEAAHPAILRVMVADPATLTPKQTGAMRDLKHMMQETKRAIAAGDLDNTVIREGDIHEFVSEALGSRRVRDWLAAQDAKPRGFADKAKEFMNAILRLLGVSTPPRGPGLEHFLNSAEKVMATPLSREEAQATYSRPKLRSQGDDALGDAVLHANSLYVRRDPSLLRDAWEQRKGLPMAMHQAMVDSRSALNKVLQRAAERGNLKDAREAQLSQLAADAGARNTAAVLDHGAYKLVDHEGMQMIEAGSNPNAKTVHDALADIPLQNTAKKEAAFQLFMSVRRGLKHGSDTLGVTPEEWTQLKSTYDTLRADPKMDAALHAAQDAYNGFNKPFIQFLMDTGYLSQKKGAELLADKDYIPWLRDGRDGTIDILAPDGSPLVKGDMRTMPWLEALRGSDMKVKPFNESMAVVAAMQTQMGVANLNSRNTSRVLAELGRDAKDVHGVVDPKMAVHVGESPVGHQHGDVMRWYENGEERWLKIDTAGTPVEDIPTNLLVQSISGTLGLMPKTLLGKFGMFSSNLLRHGVTRIPTYLASQLIKDPMAQSIQGNLASNPAAAVLKSIYNFGTIMAGKNATFDTLSKRGALNSNIYSGNASDHAYVMRQHLGERTGVVRGVLNLMDKMAHASDSATRVQAYEDAIKAGANELEATIHAQEIQNFTRKGASQGAQMLSLFVPFSAAQISGLNTLVRSARGSMPMEERLGIQRRFATRALIGASLAFPYLSHLEENDEDWQKASLQKKMSYIPTGVKVDGKNLMLPIPFEPGFVTWGLPVYVYHYLKSNVHDENAWKAFLKVASNQLPNITPPTLKAAFGMQANYDSGLGGPITPQSQAKLPPAEQRSRNNSVMEDQIAAAIRAAAPEGMGDKLNANDVKFIANTLFGQFPAWVGEATDAVFAKQTAGEKPTKSFTESPLVSRFFLNGEAKNTEGIQKAWMYANHATDTSANVKHLQEQGRHAEVQPFQQDAMKQYGTPAMAAAFKKTYGALSKQLNALEDGQGPGTANEKAAKKSALVKQMQALAENYVQRVETIRTRAY